MPENAQMCPLCGSNLSRIFDQRVFHGRVVVNRLCHACGLVYQAPRMTADEISKFYESEYREMYQGNEGPSAKDLAIQHARADALLQMIRPKVANISRHLDIGCSSGLLLQRFQNQYDSLPVGIEPGHAYRTFARKQGVTVYASLEELLTQGEIPFDMISMVHVLEHLPDPVGYLVALRESLIDVKGWLLIEVPNLYAHDCFEVAHLVSYSPHTLTQTVTKAGFEVKALIKHGHPRSSIIPYYLTIMARNSGSSKIFRSLPEKSVALKRRLGLFRRRILMRLLPGFAWRSLSS